MAFWKKKSDDPWDRDPNERPAATFYEPEPEAESEELEKKGFLSGLFGGEEPEEEPAPVPCPYCGAEMELGYLICGRGLIQWSKVTPGEIFGNFFAEAITISDEGWLNSYKTSHFCAVCRKLVVDVPEQAEEWGAPTEPTEEAADEAYERYKEQLKHYQ